MPKVLSDFFADIKENKYLLISSFFIALIIWFYAVGVYSPETAKTIKNIPLSSNISQTTNIFDNVDSNANNVPSIKFMILKGVPTTVDIVVDGLRTDLTTLSADKIKAEIDFSTVTDEGQYELPVKVRLPSNFTLVTVTPSVVNVTVAKQVTAGIEVATASTGQVLSGFALESIKSSPSIINVTGPEQIVSKIKKAVISVDVTGLNDISSKKQKFKLVDENGAEVDMTNITTDFTEVLATSNIYKSKIVPFNVTIINSSGGADDKFSTVETSPKEVEIVGSAAILNEINSIDLGVIDMAEADSKGITTTIDIVFPNGVKGLTTSNKATVSVKYPELVTKNINVSQFEFIGATGITAAVTTPKINITVRGIATDIAQLGEENVIGVVNLSSVTASGKSQAPITFKFPDGAKVSVVGKQTVSVTVR